MKEWYQMREDEVLEALGSDANGLSSEKAEALLKTHGENVLRETILKLLMRFWDVQTGRVSVDGADVREIPTKHLRNMESYVTQETHLFHDSIANNIAIAKPGATRESIKATEEPAEEAAQHCKHQFNLVDHILHNTTLPFLPLWA